MTKSDSVAPNHSPTGTKNRRQEKIHVSPALLDAAARHSEPLLQSLRTSALGLAQVEAERPTHDVGPNEVAQRNGWPIRLLKILQSLVISWQFSPWFPWRRAILEQEL